MTQDDKPAPAVVGEEEAVIEYVPPTPSRPANPKPARRKTDANAPDPFSVGVRVLKMAPAWLLFTTVCCSSLIFLLGWIRPVGDAAAVTLPPKHNDARAAKPVSPAAELSAKRPAPAAAVNVSEKAAPAASPAPAQAAQTAQTAPPAPSKAEEKAQAEAPAKGNGSGAKFTAQAGSHSDQSEANVQVSRLRAAGFDARSVAVELPGRGTWHRVQVGRFADRGEAAKTAAAMRAKGATAAIVVPLQN